MTELFLKTSELLFFSSVACTEVGDVDSDPIAIKVTEINNKLKKLRDEICTDSSYIADKNRGKSIKKRGQARLNEYLWTAIYLAEHGGFKKGADGNDYGFTMGINKYGKFEIKIDMISNDNNSYRTENNLARYKDTINKQDYPPFKYVHFISPTDIEHYDFDALVYLCKVFIETYTPDYRNL